jgi:hypothetical protein
MPLPRPRREPLHLRPGHIARHHPPPSARPSRENQSPASRPHTAPQRADPVAQPPEQNPKLLTLHHPVLALQLGRYHESHPHTLDSLRPLHLPGGLSRPDETLETRKAAASRRFRSVPDSLRPVARPLARRGNWRVRRRSSRLDTPGCTPPAERDSRTRRAGYCAICRAGTRPCPRSKTEIEAGRRRRSTPRPSLRLAAGRYRNNRGNNSARYFRHTGQL